MTGCHCVFYRCVWIAACMNMGGELESCTVQMSRKSVSWHIKITIFFFPQVNCKLDLQIRKTVVCLCVLATLLKFWKMLCKSLLIWCFSDWSVLTANICVLTTPVKSSLDTSWKWHTFHHWAKFSRTYRKFLFLTIIRKIATKLFKFALINNFCMNDGSDEHA